MRSSPLSASGAARSFTSASPRRAKSSTIKKANGANTRLVDRARELGFQDVVVIDDDLGGRVPG